MSTPADHAEWQLSGDDSRRAAYAHQAYAERNPLGWKGYGNTMWGLAACNGPAVKDLGNRLFRRPLTDEETTRYAGFLAAQAALAVRGTVDRTRATV